jgi:hypothetical protein
VGLDWQLVSPARRGKKAAQGKVRKKIAALQKKGTDDERIADVTAQLAEVEVDPFEVLHAPKIGIDDEATDWLRAGWKKGDYGRVSFKTLVARAHGQVVRDLTGPPEALPAIRGMAAGPLDFRGQALEYAGEVVGEELVAEAWNHHSAKQVLDYAARLSRALVSFRRRHPRMPKKSKDAVEIVEDAVRWLRFWGERGFGYHAWY